ncbi:MAG: hypothetical protein P8163_20475 [Candidatus Thiodiazotropha sp.]
MALQCHLQMIRAYSIQIKAMEKRLLREMQPRPEMEYLKSSLGIGDILALTIALETGNIERFKGPGNTASYSIVARKALAHKLARACYWMMKKQQAFDETLIFG